MPLTAEHLDAFARMGREILELQYQAQRLRLWLTLETAFRPDQPRVPAGNPDGGQWTTDDGMGPSAELIPVQEIIFGRLPPWIVDLLKTGRITEQELELPKEPIPGLSGKEAADQAPSWARGERPMIKESGRDFAKRLMDEKYGQGNYETGPNSEFNKIKKWGDRHFRIPRWFEDQFEA